VKSAGYYVMKFNRVIVWILLVLMVILIISGYGLTKPTLINALTFGLIDHQTAFDLHTWLDLPLFALLVIHVLIEVRLSLVRWGFKHRRLLNLLILLLGSVCLLFILYIELRV
jgi:cytochrome b subunit of formate dehydrogenase